MDLVTLVVILFSSLTADIMVAADDNEYRLVRDLMRNYDPRIRPSLNSSEALNVTFGVALAQIIDVDERNQIITTNCWLNQAWMDFKLRWDPTKYGNIEVVRLPYESIWKPDILLYNNADVSSYKSSISTNVIVSADGNVTWLSMVIFRSSCTIDVKYFPFDEQNCTMIFSSWTYDGFQVDLQKVGKDGDTSNYIKNSEWSLVKLHVQRNVVYYSCCKEPYPDVTYIIQIRRRPLFYVFNMILPCTIITLVALLGFYIPSESGEKVTMGITTLLSMTVFLMLVAENMPPTSDVLPLLGLYYGITIAIVSFATAMTVFTLNIFHAGPGGRAVPPLVKKIFLGVLAKLLCLQLETPGNLHMTTVCYERSKSKNAQHKKTYVKLKQTNRMAATSTNLDNGQSKMTVFDFPPSADSFQPPADAFEMKDRSPENGSISPRFTARLRKAHTVNTGPAATSSSPERDFEKNFVKVLQKVYQTIERNEIRLAEQDRREVIRLEWQQVALVVDRLLLVLFLFLLVGVTCGIMFQAPHTSKFVFGGPDDDVTTVENDDSR